MGLNSLLKLFIIIIIEPINNIVEVVKAPKVEYLK